MAAYAMFEMGGGSLVTTVSQAGEEGGDGREASQIGSLSRETSSSSLVKGVANINVDFIKQTEGGMRSPKRKTMGSNPNSSGSESDTTTHDSDEDKGDLKRSKNSMLRVKTKVDERQQTNKDDGITPVSGMLNYGFKELDIKTGGGGAP